MSSSWLKTVELVHPLYLNAPMMTSFLAALEDGVAFASDVVRKQQRQTETSGSGDQPESALPIASFDFNVRGQLLGSSVAGNTEEVKLLRQHTEASLFIRLRNTLKQGGLYKKLESAEDYGSVQHSDLIEVSGQIVRSPLREVLDAFSRLGGFLDLVEPAPSRSQGRSSGRGGGKPSTDTASSAIPPEVRQLFGRMKEDLEQSKVLDILMRPDAIPELTVVISLATEYMPEGALDNLLSGRFTILGKVTRKLQASETINLNQRTAFNFLSSESGTSPLDNAFENLRSSPTLNISQTASIVGAPALQILPLAIYI